MNLKTSSVIFASMGILLASCATTNTPVVLYAQTANALVSIDEGFDQEVEYEFMMGDGQLKLQHPHFMDVASTSDLQNDWNYIVNGKYSKIKNDLKRIILEHFNSNSANKIYIESYLYPEKYFDDYANILKVDVDLLQFVGELCSKPDLEKEKLLIEVVDLENIKILD